MRYKGKERMVRQYVITSELFVEGGGEGEKKKDEVPITFDLKAIKQTGKNSAASCLLPNFTAFHSGSGDFIILS